MKISFQGAKGAYSHQACLQAAPQLVPLPCPDFASTIQAVHDGLATHAMLPIDNAVAGRVADIHHLLPQSGLIIVAEIYLPIRHCVLGLKGSTLADITHVHSHMHALPQCQKIIAQHSWQKIVASDTAAAAEWVASQTNPSQAAIASAQAAQIYGLSVLAENVGDLAQNTTRFLLMTTPQHAPLKPYVANQNFVCSFVFRVKSMPAALYKALGGFATNGVNLRKLESYLLDGNFTAAQFYCEVEDHPQSPQMQHAMAELSFFATNINVLGVYEQAK